MPPTQPTFDSWVQAHDLLFDTFKDLEADKKRVPRELYRNLLLLHR